MKLLPGHLAKNKNEELSWFDVLDEQLNTRATKWALASFGIIGAQGAAVAHHHRQPTKAHTDARLTFAFRCFLFRVHRSSRLSLCAMSIHGRRQ